MTPTTYRDPEDYVYDAILEDPSPDDPAVITEADVHPSQWDD
jgi:hypothetical protein